MLKAYTLLVYLHPQKNTTNASGIYGKFKCALVRALYNRNDSAFPNGCLHNHCNVAPVRAPRSLTFKASNRAYGINSYAL